MQTHALYTETPVSQARVRKNITVIEGYMPALEEQRDNVLMPMITIDTVDYRLFTSMMTTVKRERLGKHSGNLSSYRDQIARAIEYYISWN